MLKNFLMIIIGATLISACQTSTVPIRSITRPEDNIYTEDEYSYEEEFVESEPTPMYQSQQSPQPTYDNTPAPVYSQTEETPVSDSSILQKGTGKYKIGEPYKTKDGIWYYPHEDYEYEEVGIASWYGTEFHGRPTANGEIFNKNALTGAHRTLPMPSVVKVTNLENGKSAVIRVNDRGPFTKDRILDVSQRTAQILGFEQQGSTQVKVEIMPEESKRLKELALAGNIPPASGNNNYIEEPKPIVTTVTDVEEPVDNGDLSENEMLITSPTESQISNGNYFVQIAALASLENANELKSKIRHIGPAVVHKSYVKGATMYRIRLGGFATRSEAFNYLNKAKNSGYYNAQVVREANGNTEWIK